MNKNKKEFLAQFILALWEAGGEMIDIFLTTPYKGVQYKKKSWQNERVRFKQGLHNLKYRGLVQERGKWFKLTPRGDMWYRRTLLRYYRQCGIPWDKKWRVVMFDIPSEKDRERNIFRHKLKTLGFQMLQKSVFVFPYPCERELGEICQRFKMGQYVNIILTDSLGSQDKEIREMYSL